MQMLEFLMYFLCFYLYKGKGVAPMHEYVLEHIVRLYYRIACCMFTKIGRDELLMAPHLFLFFSGKSAQGGAK